MNDPVFFAIVIGIVSGIAIAMLIWIFNLMVKSFFAHLGTLFLQQCLN
jgi:hypothetical protein